MAAPAGSAGDRSQPPTLDDVARLAGVSRQTVSRVINQSASVSEPTRRRVRRAIEELGYQPNSLARSLATQRTRVVGLVVPDISQPFYPQIARGVEDEASAAGYSVFLCHTAGSADRELQALERLRGHRVAGIINCNSRLDDETLRQLVRHVPTVLVNRDLADAPGTLIWSGYNTGSALAVEHLLSINRRRIAYIGADTMTEVARNRFAGYREALLKAGIPYDPELVVIGANSVQGGYDAMAALAMLPCQPDAVFAFNDLMAIGAMRYALTHGIDVPGQLAIVGVGGADISSMVTPGLTTVSVPLYSIGATAVQELFSLIGGATSERRQVDFPPELIVRGSTVPEARLAETRH